MDINASNHNDINGHFNPFSLSISETIVDKVSWRQRIEIAKKSGLNTNLSDLDDRDILAHFTSVHEQNHFWRYTSSELGLLITFLLQLYCNQKYSYIKLPTSNNKKTLQLYKTIIDSIYFGNTTQKEAVDSLNLFYKKFSGIARPVFKTDNPNAPTIPYNNLGFNFILEASAVLTELTQLDVATPKLNDKRIYVLLRKEFRNKALYFDLINWLESKLFYYPVINAAITYSLDIRVPILGSPLMSTPIDWEDFHPGYRLLFFTKELSNLLKIEGFTALSDFDKIWPYTSIFQAKILEDSYQIGKNIGCYQMWDDENMGRYKPNTDMIIGAMTDVGKNFVLPNLSLWKPIMDHLYFSFNINSENRKKNPLTFYSTHLIGSESDIKQLVRDKAEPAYALFSTFNGYVESYYDFIEKKIDVVIRREIFNSVLNGYLNSVSKTDTYKFISRNFRFEYKKINSIIKDSSKFYIKDIYS